MQGGPATCTHPPCHPPTHPVTQPGANPCSLLSINATLGRHANSGRHAGIVVLSLPAAPGVGASPPLAPVAWPSLGNITLLGWQVPVGEAMLSEMAPDNRSSSHTLAASAPSSGGAAAELHAYAGTASGAAGSGNVNGSWAAISGGLHFDLQALGVPLQCGYSYVLSFAEA